MAAFAEDAMTWLLVAALLVIGDLALWVLG
jgi:hypothetical protein